MPVIISDFFLEGRLSVRPVLKTGFSFYCNAINYSETTNVMKLYIFEKNVPFQS